MLKLPAWEVKLNMINTLSNLVEIEIVRKSGMKILEFHQQIDPAEGQVYLPVNKNTQTKTHKGKKNAQ